MCNRWRWESFWIDWMIRISLTLLDWFALSMNFTAIRSPRAFSASHTSANPPRPRSWISFSPANGLLPASRRIRLTKTSTEGGFGRIARTVAQEREVSVITGESVPSVGSVPPAPRPPKRRSVDPINSLRCAQSTDFAGYFDPPELRDVHGQGTLPAARADPRRGGPGRRARPSGRRRRGIKREGHQAH